MFNNNKTSLNMEERLMRGGLPLDISVQDVMEAMKRLPGYIDITPDDFKEIFQVAYGLAIQRMFNTLTAFSIMTKSPVTVASEMDLVHAAALLAENEVSGAPVVNPDGVIVGVVSEKDFLKEMGFDAAPSFMQIARHCLGNKSCMIGRLQNRIVKDIMVQPPITGTKEMTIGAVARLFAEQKINRLPIVDETMRPIGIVTRHDLAHSFCAFGEGAGF